MRPVLGQFAGNVGVTVLGNALICTERLRPVQHVRETEVAFTLGTPLVSAEGLRLSQGPLLPWEMDPVLSEEPSVNAEGLRPAQRPWSWHGGPQAWFEEPWLVRRDYDTHPPISILWHSQSEGPRSPGQHGGIATKPVFAENQAESKSTRPRSPDQHGGIATLSESGDSLRMPPGSGVRAALI